jgi:hypothetical protein
LALAHPKGDQGENLVPVRCGTGCSSIKNLHSFWDGVLGSSESTAYAIEAAARLPKTDVARAAIDDEQRWIDESVAIAKSTVYASIPADLGETCLS